MAKNVYAQWSLESYCIGMKLRSLRTQKRLTLARLATETGLSTALLSKLETDRMVPTLPTLATISRVYGVGMSYFFAEPARHTLSITRKALFGAHERITEQVKITPLNAVEEGTRRAAAEAEAPDAAAVAKGRSSRAEGARSSRHGWRLRLRRQRPSAGVERCGQAPVPRARGVSGLVVADPYAERRFDW
jgi:transcriptional regulator with XRE-family HTH domain